MTKQSDGKDCIDASIVGDFWHIIYGPERKVYRCRRPGIWEWAQYSHGGGDDTGCNVQSVIDGYISGVRENPSVDINSLVKSLVERENKIRVRYNKEAMADSGNPYYDSSECNHWTRT